MILDTLDIAHNIVDVLASRMGADILLLDISPLTLIADYFVIATGESERQLHAMVEAVEDKLKTDDEIDITLVSRPEGTPASGWVLLDLGAIVVHLFSPSQREHYQLEELWEKARIIVRMA